MSNISQTTYTSQNIRNSKFLLITGIAVAVVIDALISVLLIVGGYSFKFIVFPAVLLLLDAVYLVVGATATNYRFKYSLAVWLLYVLFTCVFCISGTMILLNTEGTVATNVALILWAAVHAVSVICAIVTALYTSKKLTSAVITGIVTLLLSAACIFYAVFLFTNGFFGQGYGLRTLVYDYDSVNDCYTVSGVLSGNSQRVEIADTFNGKPVRAIDCKVLCEASVKEYVLHDNFVLIGTQALAEGEFEGKSIQVKSDDASLFRAKLFECAKTSQNRTNALKLANATVPYALQEGEGYIAFDYDEAAYTACNGNVIPLVIGAKGQSISLSDYASTHEYLNHADKTSVADLKWSYENCNGFILDNLSSDSRYVFSDSTNVKVQFEEIYQVYVQSGNDAKYDIKEKQTEFCCDELNGTAFDFRYVAKSNADSFFKNFTPREGFTLEWKYGRYGTTGGQTFSNLADVFEQIDYSTVYIYPEWKLNNPTIELQQNYAITYGENVTFSPTAASPADGISLMYKWEHNGTNVGTSKDLTLTTPSLSGEYDGQYTLTVTTDGGEVTSLTSSASSTLALTINKKTISFGWDIPAEGDMVYSGTEKTVTATIDKSQLVGDDSLTYTLSGYDTPFAGCIDAGNYTFSVEISGTSAKNYIVDNSGVISLTITPLPVEVTWSNYSLTYNGLIQSPTASALGVGKDSAKQLVTVSGGQKDAGENYIATAYCSDGNYTLTNSICNYTIAKAPLTVTANDCTLAYGVPLTDSGAVFSGFVNDETDSVLGGELSYFFANSYSTVGTYSGCVKISGLTSDNYDITFVPGDLTITQRAIVVIWQNATNLTYNGKEQNVWPGINNRVPGDDVLAVVTGGNAIDAGNYTATVTGLTGNDAGNYKITETISKDYTIAKEKVSITPISYSVTYGDAEEQLYANVEGTIYNDDFTYELKRVSGTAVNVYTITVSVTGNTQNYELSTYTGTYTITKRMVSLTWNAPADLVYNGLEKAVTVDVHNFIEGDDVTVIAANCNQTNAGSYTATASLSGSKAGNYEIYSTQTSFSYTIDQRLLTLTWNVPADLTYNAQNKTVTATLNNVVDGDSVSVIITNGSLRDAGSYTAIAALSGTDAKNYKLSGSTTQNYIISPAKVTISANNATTVYGELIPKLTASISGTIYNDELIWSVNTSANDIVPAPAGSYEITVEVVANPNYSVTTVNGTYTVTKATPILKGITGGVYTVSEEAEYGTTLEEISSKLPAQTLEGTWTWTDGNDKVAEAGTNIYEVKFVPSDSDNFNSVTVSVTITVKAADPVIEG